MPIYEYVALGRDGGEVRGAEEAIDRDALGAALRRRNLHLVDAKQAKSARVPFALASQFVAELSRLVASGIVLERSLQIVGEDSRDKRLAALGQQLRQSVQRGQAFSEALRRAGDFDPVLIALVRVGEASGQLGTILESLETYYAGRATLRKDLVATLAYPIILVAVSVASLIGLGLYVVPVFRGMFATEKIDLPLGTVVIFMVSDWLSEFGTWFATGLAALIFGFYLALRLRPALSARLQALWLRLPFLGEVTAKFEAARALGVIGITVRSGVHLVQAMELAQQALRTPVQREGVEEAIRQLRKGVALPAALEAVPFWPRLAQRFVRIGNETGKVAEMCERAAVLLEAEARTAVRALVAAAGPVVIVVMGSVIGFVVVSMLLAVFSLSDIR
ncbi:MAG: hypothetical protein A3J29_13160 [Acidobacteria bacterium RIFCSPLOWO2_12_FULL_67_14b]|nr:MAG: hypothetical protein A3J29_13160 [Acidobacteria bacterium RIFCSPLOWO2_12_FULL_67_14b]